MKEHCLPIFKSALSWIHKNTIKVNENSSGITVTSKQQIPYPEVTGYYIPTLIQWGERDLAVSYARYLCSIQKEDGAWWDSGENSPYIFDTAQILKGLVSIYPLLPEVKGNIIRGCEWLCSRVDDDGRLVPPQEDTFPQEENFYSELIHLYCLTPLHDAGKLFSRDDWIVTAKKVLGYYTTVKRDRIEDFSLLSHFYAYVMEALVDLGEFDLARKAMDNLSKYQVKEGVIPGLKNVSWVCSTGLFQLAIVWYKLGEKEKGRKMFEYACSLQNKSGGWYGSYSTSVLSVLGLRHSKPKYFPKEEISWANKYFLDALYWDQKLHFEDISAIFLDTIEKNDGRYQLIKNIMEKQVKNREQQGMASELDVCDAGCGKGRYLKNLLQDMPKHQFYAMDLSLKVMENIEGVRDKRVGTLTCLPYKDESFDVVYACESFEHAIHIESAFCELVRVTKTEGIIVIIDKPVEKLHKKIKLDSWEQWIDDMVMEKFARNCNVKIKMIPSVPYEGKDDGLFRAWIIEKSR